MEWIDIKKSLPKKEGFYKVKILRGSMKRKEIERIAMFKLKGFPRFVVGDWETVTFWKHNN